MQLTVNKFTEKWNIVLSEIWKSVLGKSENNLATSKKIEVRLLLFQKESIDMHLSPGYPEGTYKYIYIKKIIY